MVYHLFVQIAAVIIVRKINDMHAWFVDLIRQCLREEREERPSANEIIAEITVVTF